MKKVLFVLFALGCLNMSSYASRLEAKASNEVELTVKYHDPTAGNNDLPRGPVQIPQAFIDSYTLYIIGANGNYTLQLETADGVAYSLPISGSTGSDMVILPQVSAVHTNSAFTLPPAVSVTISTSLPSLLSNQSHNPFCMK